MVNLEPYIYYIIVTFPQPTAAVRLVTLRDLYATCYPRIVLGCDESSHISARTTK